MATVLATRDPPTGSGEPLSGPDATAAAGSTRLPMRAETAGAIVVRSGRRLMPWRNSAERGPRLSLAWLSFAVIAVLPVLLAALYFLLIAADQYVAEFRFALRSAEPIPAQFGALLPADVTRAPVAADSYIVVQYIRSRALVDDLGRTLDLRRIFSTRRADWPARLHLPVSVEELVDYWRGQTDAFFDPANGTIVVRVRAFSAPTALALAQGTLSLSEQLVNRLSARARQNALHDSEADVGTSEQRLTAALAHLRDFRDQEGLIDPNKAANSSEALADRVRDALVRAKTELSTLQQYMRDDAPPVKLLEARIQSLEEQRRAVESGVTDTAEKRSQTLSRVMGRYEELEIERHFAENAYQHALEARDRSRLNADRQQVYIADFVPPRLPEEALYPRRARSLAIVFLVAFAVWSIGSLTTRSLRDHL
jgi:capsular polysaccharide transport system permease protein